MEQRLFSFSLLDKFPEIVYGISSRNNGDMHFGNLKDKEVINNRRQFYKSLEIDEKDVVVMDQVHGNNIANVGSNDRASGIINKQSAISKTDGLITKDANLFLMIQTADCLAIFFYDPEKRIIGAVHAGWRGIIKQICLKMIDKFIELGSSPEKIICCIGPGICQKHFVVKDAVLKEFLKKYSSATFVRNNDGYIDLKKAIVSDLKKGGIASENIEISKYCTVCDNGILGSFRKEGSSAQESASIIGMKL